MSLLNLCILDSKQVSEMKKWYLAKSALYDYLKALKTDFYAFDIQRKIVKNVYLDDILDTIKKGDPLSLITLISEQTINIEENHNINMDTIEIIDGLQRSMRLWAILKVVEEFIDNDSLEIREFYIHFKNKYKELDFLFKLGILSLSVINTIIKSDPNEILEKFKTYEIYFALWTGLNQYDVIEKMLILNAGQKSVSVIHQFELMFLHTLKSITSRERLNIVRERDTNYNDVKTGNREVGQFTFYALVICLASMAEGKAIRAGVEGIKQVSERKEEEDDILKSRYLKIFNVGFLTQFEQNLYLLDQKFYDLNAAKWFGKDTTLAGLGAAIGSYHGIEDFNEIFQNILNNMPNNFDTYGFEEEYNRIAGKSVNIGMVIRKASQLYFSAILNNESPSWEKIFSQLQAGK